MELGIDPRHVEALRALLRRTARDPLRLRCAVALVLAGAGWAGLLMPLGDRVAAARTDHEAALEQRSLADALEAVDTELTTIAQRLPSDTDEVTWQGYLIDLLSRSGLRLSSLEPLRTDSAGPFDVVELQLTAVGTRYDSVVDFVDRLEHGPRPMRVEHLDLRESPQGTVIDLLAKALVLDAALRHDGEVGDG